MFFLLKGKKKESRKNGSPKKQNQWAVSPEYTQAFEMNIVQTLGVILPGDGILSRYFCLNFFLVFTSRLVAEALF